MEKFDWQQKMLFALSAMVAMIFFGILMMLIIGGISYSNFKSILFPSLFLGLFLGVGLPFILKKMSPALERNVKTPKLREDENIIFEGRANLFRNWWIAAGGKLFLTNKRLIFNAHKYNFQKGETSIEIPNIVHISERKTAYIVDNGLRVETMNSTEYDFVVNNRSKWLRLLEN